jgi:hypothetical protein
VSISSDHPKMGLFNRCTPSFAASNWIVANSAGASSCVRLISAQTMFKPILFAAVLLLLSSLPTLAQLQSGNELLLSCEVLERGLKVSGDKQLTIPHDPQAFMCWGFMAAIQQLSTIREDNRRILNACPPPTSTLTQLIRVFTNYAQSHPEELHQPAAWIAVNALRHAFPCLDTD